MVLDRLHRNAELLGNLFVGVAAGDETEELPLARREVIELRSSGPGSSEPRCFDVNASGTKPSRRARAETLPFADFSFEAIAATWLDVA